MNDCFCTKVRYFSILLLGLLLIHSVFGQQDRSSDKENEVSVLVTAMPHNDRTRRIAAGLQLTDFEVLEDKKAQKITSARKAAGDPVIIAVLIQDSLISRVNNELGEIRNFIKSLPDGSRVMTGYLRSGTVQIRQKFTVDKNKAAKSLRILASSTGMAPFSPYLQVADVLQRFEGEPEGRRMILMVSDGLEGIPGRRIISPYFSAYLDKAVREAQRRGVAVFSIYAPSAGRVRFRRHAANYGQASLLRLSEETGGEAFFSGLLFVSFNPYFDEYQELLKNQWLIKYKSESTKKGFRKIEVTTDFDLHLHHLAGYELKN